MWRKIKTNERDYQKCPECKINALEKFIATDEAGTEYVVAARCRNCDWEKIYLPDLAGLIGDTR